MRTFTLFYSWQSDRPSDLCRNFIFEALKLAAEKIQTSRQIIVAIDADTQGVSGTPPISETILKKIDACDAFLADLTLVATTPSGKASPNPNVLIEYGYALKAKGSPHLILAMNTAFGGPENLPFDLRHLRHPLQYAAEENLAAGERRKLRAQFAEKLVVALNGVIDQAPARKKAAAKGPDPEVLAGKRLAGLKINRDHGPFPIVRVPRVILDIVPFVAEAERRLDLRAVKAARSWFAPADDLPANTSTKQGEWISSDPVDQLLTSYPEARWSTRLIAPGVLERMFSISRPVTRRVDQTMDGVACDRLIVTALRRSGQLLAAVGLEGAALARLSIEGGEDLRVTTPLGAGPPLGTSFVTFSPVQIHDLRDPDPEAVRPMLDDFWQACGWEDGTPSIDERGWTQPFLRSASAEDPSG